MDEKLNPQKEEKEIPRELNNLSNGLTRLQEVVAKLSAKLHPVLRPANPSANGEKVTDTMKRSVTPLSEMLGTYGDKVYAAVEDIDYMINRLEL